MLNFYIPHKIKIGEITKLSDQDSKFAIANNIELEQQIYIESNGNKYIAKILKINTNSIDVIIEDIIIEKNDIDYEIVLLQSLIHTHKYKYVIEKAVEIGVHSIQPIYSEYSTESIKKIAKMNNIWRNTIKDAKEQSRNSYDIKYNNPIEISNLGDVLDKDSIKICMSTENIQKTDLGNITNEIIKNKKIYIAIGPERGWGVEDINIFSNLSFQFIQLNGNILRTETASLVILSMIKYIKEYK